MLLALATLAAASPGAPASPTGSLHAPATTAATDCGALATDAEKIACLTAWVDALSAYIRLDAGALEVEGHATEAWVRRQAYPEGLGRYVAVDEAEDAVVFTGANVHVRSGSGYTDDNTSYEFGDGAGALTGRGNLIIGYDEHEACDLDGDGEDDGAAACKSGSHNLVVGPGHAYTSAGGLLAGFGNAAGGLFASVAGGYNNHARGQAAAVAGGVGNWADGGSAAVIGGLGNRAEGSYAAIAGGLENTAAASFTAACGGGYNVADRFGAATAGGFYNTASGDYAAVSGGTYNTAWGVLSAVSGGSYNETRGIYASVSGGYYNTASGHNAAVSGGADNAAEGDYASVVGGEAATAAERYELLP